MAQAILDANADTSGPHEIRFAISTTGSQQTISLTDESGVQASFVGALPPTPGGDPVEEKAVAEYLRNVVSGNRGWGVHVSGLVVPGQERGIFHAERRRDPFKVPYEMLVDPESETSAVKPYGTLANSVAGNFVGVDGTGAAAAPNGQGGVLVDKAAAATLVGAWSIDLDRHFYGNVISANGDPGSDAPGVLVTGQGTSVTVVAGNLIGLAADGQTALGNAGPGVKVSDGALATNIGGDTYAANLGSRNYIAGNDGPGILIEDAFDFRRAITFPGPGESAADRHRSHRRQHDRGKRRKPGEDHGRQHQVQLRRRL